MKKIIATVLATVMILSVLATIAIVPATAAVSEDGGDWAVYAPAKTYKDENGQYIFKYDDPDMSRTNIPGYEYTDAGFRVSGTCSASTATTQRFNVVTKKPQNLSKGVSVTIEVDEFKAGGDMWFSFSIWDEPNLDHGEPGGKFGEGFGNGYLCLIRDGVIQNWIADDMFYDKSGTMQQPGSANAPCQWNLMDGGQGTPNNNFAPNANGNYEFTFNLVCDTTGTYSLYINGVAVPAGEAFDAFIKQRFVEMNDGMGYIGFAVRGSETDCTTTITVTEFNGKVPTGKDSAEQFNNVEPVGPMIPTDTLDPSQPVLLFDSLNKKGEYEKIGEFTMASDVTAVPNYDGSFTIYPQSSISSYLVITPDNDFTYEASDYPYAAFLFRNFCNCIQYEGEDYECIGNQDNHFVDTYFSGGTIFEADPTCLLMNQSPAHADIYKDIYGNTYQLYIIDLSQQPSWMGRINSFRIDFDYDEILRNDKDHNSFDFCYMGYFQTFEAAANYAVAYKDAYVECQHDGATTFIPAEEPTCSQTGKTMAIRCDVCGKYTQTSEIIPALDHVWKDVEAESPTCTEYGRTAGQECTLCHTKNGTLINPIDHDMVYNNTTEEGHYKVCSYECGKKTEMEDHTLDENNICTVCGYGCAHENTTLTETVAPTCTTPGKKAEVCDDCGATVAGTDVVVNALGHTEEVLPAVDATCTEAGRKEGKKCSVCNAVTVVQETIPARGHTEETIPAVDATCKDTGLTEGKKCTVCDAITVEQTQTAVAPHTYDNDTDADCNVCGAKRTINTQPPENNTPSEGENNEGGDEKKGCGSVIGLGAFAVIATVALAGVVSLKKKD